jgi:hypothetical protein
VRIFSFTPPSGTGKSKKDAGAYGKEPAKINGSCPSLQKNVNNFIITY